MTDETKPAPPPERAPDGRWVGGTPSPNPTGRPPKIKEERFVNLIKKAVSDEDVIAIIHKAVEQAKDGNRWARSFLWEYAVGRPRQMPGQSPREAPVLTLLKMWTAQKLIGGTEEVETLAAGLRLQLPEPEE